MAQLARRDRIVSADRFLVFLDSLPRPAHRLLLRDQRRRHAVRRHALQRRLGQRHLGRRLGGQAWRATHWAGPPRCGFPYSQLRFQRQTANRWGINFKRDIARRNERDYLVCTPSNGSGFVSRFADLVGLERGHAPRPARGPALRHDQGRVPEPRDGRPLQRRLPTSARAPERDLKLGIGSNLTLDATVNPDFGQVEVDPAVVNLSDVETFFDERRPFFVEGANIFEFGYGGANDYWGFNWADPELSLQPPHRPRAAGARIPTTYDYSSVPSGTSILGAAKLSGKIGSWSFGTLSALTSREQAQFALGPQRWQQEVEPLTYYGVYRGSEGDRRRAPRPGLHRNRDGPLLRRARSSAMSSARAPPSAGTGWMDHAGPERRVGGERLGRTEPSGGTAERMQGLQQSSVHYFQRPDAVIPRGGLRAHLAVRLRRPRLAQQAEGQLDVQLGGGRGRSRIRGERPRLPVPRRSDQLASHVRPQMDPAQPTSSGAGASISPGSAVTTSAGT